MKPCIKRTYRIHAHDCESPFTSSRSPSLMCCAQVQRTIAEASRPRDTVVKGSARSGAYMSDFYFDRLQNNLLTWTLTRTCQNKPRRFSVQCGIGQDRAATLKIVRVSSCVQLSSTLPLPSPRAIRVEMSSKQIRPACVQGYFVNNDRVLNALLTPFSGLIVVPPMRGEARTHRF